MTTTDQLDSLGFVLRRWLLVAICCVFGGELIKVAAYSPDAGRGSAAWTAAVLFVVGVLVVDRQWVRGGPGRQSALLLTGVIPDTRARFWRSPYVLPIVGVVVLAIVAAIASYYLAFITTAVFPRADGLVDDRGDFYNGHRDNYVWVWAHEFMRNALPEELSSRAPVLAAYILLIANRDGRADTRHWLGGTGVAMFSAVWFALRHSEYGMWNISHAFLIGVLYTGLTVITRTLWPAVLAHATYNTAVML